MKLIAAICFLFVAFSYAEEYVNDKIDEAILAHGDNEDHSYIDELQSADVDTTNASEAVFAETESKPIEFKIPEDALEESDILDLTTDDNEELPEGHNDDAEAPEEELVETEGKSPEEEEHEEETHEEEENEDEELIEDEEEHDEEEHDEEEHEELVEKDEEEHEEEHEEEE